MSFVLLSFFQLKSRGSQERILTDLEMLNSPSNSLYFSQLPQILFEKVLDTSEDLFEGKCTTHPSTSCPFAESPSLRCLPLLPPVGLRGACSVSVHHFVISVYGLSHLHPALDIR